MLILQIVASISSMVLQNCVLNRVCKRELPSTDHVYRFNIISYAVCILFFGLIALGGGISFFTVGVALVFGVVTALNNYYKMLALADGPMHITLLITTSSMIIPTMSGVFFGEAFSLAKLLIVFVLLFFIYLSLEKKKGARVNRRWLLYCALTFLAQGSVGVLQKIHQSSEHKGEIGAFLFVAFICSVIYNHLCAKQGFAALHFTRRHYALALVCGVCIFGMNFLNLRLSGLLPSQLFFPIVNGSAIVLSSLFSVLLFREHLSKKQIVGLVGGIASLVAICLVP